MCGNGPGIGMVYIHLWRKLIRWGVLLAPFAFTVAVRGTSLPIIAELRIVLTAAPLAIAIKTSASVYPGPFDSWVYPALHAKL